MQVAIATAGRADWSPSEASAPPALPGSPGVPTPPAQGRLVQFPVHLPRRGAARPQTVRNAVQRLATARFISLAGSDATGVALGFALYAQTHSPKWISLSLLLTIGAGALLAPLGGRLGDLADRRRLMIVTEVSSAAVFLALALVHTPVALLALGLLATVIGTVFGPASGAAIAHVAGEQHMTWA